MTKLEAIRAEVDDSVCISVANARWLMARVNALARAVEALDAACTLEGLHTVKARAALADLDEEV